MSPLSSKFSKAKDLFEVLKQTFPLFPPNLAFWEWISPYQESVHPFTCWQSLPHICNQWLVWQSAPLKDWTSSIICDESDSECSHQDRFNLQSEGPHVIGCLQQLINIFAANLPIWICNLRMYHVMVTGTHLSQGLEVNIEKSKANVHLS